MQIGEVEAHSLPEHPWKAEDIAWLPNGDFYTVGLARIDRFNAAGELQASLLSPGSGPGEFADLHGLILDAERHRILVADRGNSASRCLTTNGTSSRSGRTSMRLTR